MAKVYRATALIRNEDIGLPIRRARKEQAIERLGHYVSQFDDAFIFQLAGEIGLDECLSYSEDGAIDFDMTDLQVVCMCAALAASFEFREARRARTQDRKNKRRDA